MVIQAFTFLATLLVPVSSFDGDAYLARMDAAKEAYLGCLMSRARQFDDGRSPVAGEARRVARACEVDLQAYEAALTFEADPAARDAAINFMGPAMAQMPRMAVEAARNQRAR